MYFLLKIVPGKAYLWKLSRILGKCTYSTLQVEISTRSGFSVRDRSWVTFLLDQLKDVKGTWQNHKGIWPNHKGLQLIHQ